MHIRYVEKASSDILSFKKLFEHQADVFISACAQLSEVGASPSDPPIDLLLIDVMDQDKSSVEDHVRTARQYTTAPIVFLAGAGSGLERLRILAPGAASVVSKQEMSAEMIYRLLETVKTKAPPPSDSPVAADVPLFEIGSSFPGWDRAFEYLRRGFDALSEASGRSEDPTDGREWRRILAYVREIGKRDQGESCECDAATLLADAREELIDFAERRHVPLLIDVASPAGFFVVGSEIDARLGLDAVVSGLVGLCGARERLRIALYSEDGDQAILTALADRPLAVEVTAMFSDAAPADQPPCFGITALQCGAALLGLRREQCDFSGAERGEIKLRL